MPLLPLSPFSPLAIPHLTLRAAFDIAVAAILIYNFLSAVRGRRAAHVVSGMLVLVGVYLAAVWAKLAMVQHILEFLAPYSVIAVIVIFQAELRRLLARLGRNRWLTIGGQLERREMVDEILLAVKDMAERKTGLLIAIEGDVGLRTFIESGVAMDARVSRDLLCAIFHHGAELHDGAVIIQGDLIAAAACFLPLTTNPGMVHKMGTRHRAAIGITEESDALVLIVSEETGHIGIASAGDFEPDVSAERLRVRLNAHITGRTSRPFPKRITAHPGWKILSLGIALALWIWMSRT